MKTINKSFSKFFFALLLVATISFSISFSSYAQSTTSFGIKGGVNLANFRGEDVKDASNRTAFNIGALLNYSVAESVGLSFEVDYSSQGAVNEGSTLNVGGIDITTDDATVKLDYLRTTLLFNYYMGSSEMNIRPELFAGPYLGFLLNSQAKSGSGDYEDYPDNTFKGTDFGAAFGAGLHIRVGERMWLVPDVRYNLGLSNIYDSDNVTARNGVLSVNLGLTFPLN
ncbi:porin family protein [Bernardetia sp. ABR2-2B]|uniref:porin family protein n=1 Tax=Bernardetia sp. ABR2-2B TaxID=3127472 RepID=UPI0030D212B2